MEMRTITILDSATQSKHVINTNVETFGELKKLARQAGINIDDKDWKEGFSKTIPIDDSSILPTNVPYKGRYTNDLVYMITASNKKTESGADRKELYDYIKEHNLAEDIKYTFGDNYTRIKSTILEDYIVNINKSKDNAGSVRNEDSVKDNAKKFGVQVIVSIVKSLGITDEVVKGLTEKKELTDEEIKELFQ